MRIRKVAGILSLLAFAMGSSAILPCLADAQCVLYLRSDRKIMEEITVGLMDGIRKDLAPYLTAAGMAPPDTRLAQKAYDKVRDEAEALTEKIKELRRTRMIHYTEQTAAVLGRVPAYRGSALDAIDTEIGWLEHERTVLIAQFQDAMARFLGSEGMIPRVARHMGIVISGSSCDAVPQ